LIPSHILKSKNTFIYPTKKKKGEMEGIDHRMVSVNGITMHIAEKGPKEGPVVLLLHGFPDLWYTWRHQISGLSSLGYRAVAPDLRGYGDSDSPESFSEYTCLNVVGDLVALLDSVAGNQEKVFLVGHDWGAIIGWFLCLFRPEKINGFVCLSVPYRSRNPKVKPVQGFKAVFGDDYYICRFQVLHLDLSLLTDRTNQVTSTTNNLLTNKIKPFN